jgi:hypothetical protein
MSRNGSIDLDFGDGTYTFRLAIGQLRELQESVNRPRIKLGASLIGPATLFEAVRSNNAWPHEVREIMRLGLIGGGTKPADALDLVRRYVEERPIVESSIHATLVLGAALFGSEEEAVEGKKQPAEMTGESTSPLPGSMAGEPS